MDVEDKIKNFGDMYGITITNRWAAKNPYMDDVEGYMNHYKSTLRIRDENGARTFTLTFSQGRAIKDKPTVFDVLYCLYMDMSCAKDGLEWFLDNLGYDEGKGTKIFNQIEKQTDKLYKFLGDSKFRELEHIDDLGN